MTYTAPPKAWDPLPDAADVARHARLLRIAGKNPSAWMIERLALHAGIVAPGRG